MTSTGQIVKINRKNPNSILSILNFQKKKIIGKHPRLCIGQRRKDRGGGDIGGS